MKVVHSNVLHTEQSNFGHIIELDNGKWHFICEKTSDTHIHAAKTTAPCSFSSLEQILDVTQTPRKEGIFRHKKKGTYRLIKRNVLHGATLGHVYEHMYPYGHSVSWRPAVLFDNENNFKLIPLGMKVSELDSLFN